uniref:Uncharacterized protein n=1 Tax=Anguilla anguilla TaxID=7936 RepID=A0A0E9UL91_ANGAN
MWGIFLYLRAKRGKST